MAVPRQLQRCTSWMHHVPGELALCTAMQDHLIGEQARLTQSLANGGVEALIRGVGANVEWSGSALHLQTTGIGDKCRTTLRLNGRELVVTPSYFAVEPVTYWPADTSQPVLLVTPTWTPRPSSTGPSSRRASSELLGRTRTDVLMILADQPHTTTQLSQALEIAISGASQHAGVLRRAGLITTTRHGGRVIHAISELGLDLVAAIEGGTR